MLNLAFERLMTLGSVVIMLTFSRYLASIRRLQLNTRIIILLLFIMPLLNRSTLAVLEINNISPQYLANTAMIYWEGVILLYSLNRLIGYHESLRYYAVVDDSWDKSSNKFYNPIFVV